MEKAGKKESCPKRSLIRCLQNKFVSYTSSCKRPKDLDTKVWEMCNAPCNSKSVYNQNASSLYYVARFVIRRTHRDAT